MAILVTRFCIKYFWYEKWFTWSKKTHFLMENGSSKVQETNKILSQKYMGLKKMIAK
jgi:hypothetical protein